MLEKVLGKFGVWVVGDWEWEIRVENGEWNKVKGFFIVLYIFEEGF